MDHSLFAATYLDEVSNQADPRLRHAAIDRLFDPALRYLDDEGPVRGRDAFAARIDHLASLMQDGHRFVLTRPPQVLDRTVVFWWELGAPGQVPVVVGINLVVFHHDLVSDMHASTL